MGLITLSSLDQYRASIRQLFPRGEFWDTQFADAESDLSKWCDAKAMELHRFKTRRADLLEESMISTSDELLSNWEKTFGSENPSLPVSERRAILNAIGTRSISRPRLEAVIAGFGGSLLHLELGQPAQFGRTTCGSFFGSPASSNSVMLYVDLPDTSLRPSLAATLRKILLASCSITLLYRTEENVFIP